MLITYCVLSFLAGCTLTALLLNKILKEIKGFYQYMNDYLIPTIEESGLTLDEVIEWVESKQ